MKPIVKHQTLVMALLCGCVGSSDPELGEGATSTSGGDSTTTSSGEGIPTTGGEDNSTTAGVDCNDAAPCDGICCEPGELCSAGACLIAGAACSDLEACPEGQYCDYGLGGMAVLPNVCAPGAPALAGSCVPRPKLCAPGIDPQDAEASCAVACEGPAENLGPIDLQVKYEWTGEGYVATDAIVIQLDDDNCNGKIDENDLPEILVASVPDILEWWADGATIHSLSVRNGQLSETWRETPDFGVRPYSLAAGNVDGKPGNEVVVCSWDKKAGVLSGEGQVLWVGDESQDCFYPSVADFSADGNIEILTSSVVVDGQTGVLEAGPIQTVSLKNGGDEYFLKRPIAVDLDGDGILEIALPDRVLDSSGKVLFETGALGFLSSHADLDGDSRPEMVVTQLEYNQPARFSIWKYTTDGGTLSGAIPVRQGLSVDGPLSSLVCPQSSPSAGFPTLGDLNRDDVPDVLIAGSRGIVAFDGAKLIAGQEEAQSVLWSAAAASCNNRFNGSTVFDLDGDGRSEVIFNDSMTLYVFDGETGAVRAEVCNQPGSATGAPVVADIDGDGRAEIIVTHQGSPGYNCADGNEPLANSVVRVFDVPGTAWAMTRPVWNEELYRVTNIENDGSVPAKAKVDWGDPARNSFRTNLQIPVERAAPDLRAEITTDCAAEKFRAIARIGNAGQALAPAGVVVEFYEGTPEEGQILGTVQTTAILGPGQVEDVMLELGTVPDGFEDGSTKLTVRVVTDALLLPQGECNIENNLAILEEACKK